MKSRKAAPDQPAGWYPDPDGSGELVYFDGQAWTDARVASYSDGDSNIPEATAIPVAPAASRTHFTPSSSAPRLPHRPSKILRPFYLYAGAAIGLVRLAGRVSLPQYCVFLGVNATLVALAINVPPTLGWTALGVFSITSLIVSIPRLHDTGHAGTELYWLPALALPLIGWLQGLRLLRNLFTPGHLGSNPWGPPPI